YLIYRRVSCQISSGKDAIIPYLELPHVFENLLAILGNHPDIDGFIGILNTLVLLASAFHQLLVRFAKLGNVDGHGNTGGVITGARASGSILLIFVLASLLIGKGLGGDLAVLRILIIVLTTLVLRLSLMLLGRII